ncbi:AAA family ATPase [Pararhizobium sp. BT-229]|uniref:AAA family ATPase n=1 Tax=Pararhizobium sp. BT-229 TaxID=2986923 RepID=UPI0021F7C5B9|nr:AAA family ATPase [Pararhizobium sp. BT-229]MCV9960336.1 AAA family ATPase [Pararhizobium sp. BT-229]
MSSAPKPTLRIRATSLGPVAQLDADLSKFAQNLVYARNGTGKSFLTRALRYLDLHGEGQDIQDAPTNLIAEESTNGQGMFELSQGGTNIGRLSLNLTIGQATPQLGDCIFHVFSDDFVHSELRQSNFVVNGNIESKITLDQTIISTKDAEGKLERAETRLRELTKLLEQEVNKAKEEQLSTKAGVNRRLKEYVAIQLSELMSGHPTLPSQPARNFGNILSDLDTLKSVPAEPDYPNDIEHVSFSASVFDIANGNLSKMTSPSSVAEEIKAKIASYPTFIEAGIEQMRSAGDESCPFCEQSVAHPPAKDLIASYIAFFADAEGAHKKALREDWSRIKGLRTAVAACETSFSRNLSKYDNLKKLVPSQKNVSLPNLSKSVEATDTFLGAYAEAIQRKGISPGAEVRPPEVDISSSFASLREIIAGTNQAFLALRGAISASDTERRNLQREACDIFAIEFVRSNWSSFEAIRTQQEDVHVAAAELAELKKSQLSDNAKDRVATTFEALIISFFGQKYSFDKTSFTLRRDNREMVRGPSRTLSDGEKTVIAFCYFIACVHKKVKTTSDYGKVFLVFDDPITSMSYDYVFAIAQTLKHLSISTTGTVSINPGDINKGFLRPDLLVFTHSSYFYNICVTNRVVKEEAAFFLHKTGQSHQLSKLKKYIAPFEEYLREIVGVHGGTEPTHTTGHAIRCVLEAVGRFCHPDKCDSLSNYISYLAGEEGFEIKSVLINNLSHGSYYDETPSPDELRDACDEVIRIVEKYAKGQLEVARALHGAAGAAGASGAANL